MHIRIGIETPDGRMDCHVLRPSGVGSWPAVILYMDALGMRTALLAIADRVSQRGYLVVVPDLYYRAGVVPSFDPREVFKGGPERDRMMKLVAELTAVRVMRDTASILEMLNRQAEVAGDSIGCVGYCMGGRFALTAAGTFPERVIAAASFHGSRLATDSPESPHLLAPRMRARVYVGVAGIDPGLGPREGELLARALADGGVRHQIEVYPEVQHGFAVEDLPVYDQAASERHFERLLELFEFTLRAGLMRLPPPLN